MKRREFITLLGGAIAPVILVTALLVVWPVWLRTAQAQSWASDERVGVRHIVVTLNKSRTLRFDKPFASAVVGAPDIMDALPMSDRVLYIQGKKVGTTDVSVFDQSMKLIGVLDVEVAIDTGRKTKREVDDDLTWNVVYTSGPAKGLGRYFSNGNKAPGSTWLDPKDRKQVAEYERKLIEIYDYTYELRSVAGEDRVIRVPRSPK